MKKPTTVGFTRQRLSVLYLWATHDGTKHVQQAHLYVTGEPRLLETFCKTKQGMPFSRQKNYYPLALASFRWGYASLQNYVLAIVMLGTWCLVAGHSSSHSRPIISSLATKGWAVQKISSGQKLDTQTDRHIDSESSTPPPPTLS